MALLRARHEQSRDIADVNTLIEVAESSGLEMPRFQEDLSNRQLLSKLAEDHTLAVETLGVFGTPTLVFPGRQAVFLKMIDNILNEQWQEMLGEQASVIHNEWLHTIGNLTLSGYNPDMGNQPFDEKRKVLSDSHIELNRDIVAYDLWNGDTIKARAAMLADRALTIWKQY